MLSYYITLANDVRTTPWERISTFPVSPATSTLQYVTITSVCRTVRKKKRTTSQTVFFQRPKQRYQNRHTGSPPKHHTSQFIRSVYERQLQKSHQGDTDLKDAIRYSLSHLFRALSGNSQYSFKATSRQRSSILIKYLCDGLLHSRVNNITTPK